ncbi:MAG: hypothetical protein ABWJ97_06395 [Thermoproteus sp.]
MCLLVATSRREGVVDEDLVAKISESVELGYVVRDGLNVDVSEGNGPLKGVDDAL